LAFYPKERTSIVYENRVLRPKKEEIEEAEKIA
jgi:hypothetical protein